MQSKSTYSEMSATKSRKVHMGVYYPYTWVCTLHSRKVHMGVYSTKLAK